MLSKFIEWFEFHTEMLDRKKQPLFIWSLGAVVACLSIFVYEGIVAKLYDSFLNKLIVNNMDILRHGLWIIPLAIFLWFWGIGLNKHKKNIDKIFGSHRFM